MLHHTPRGARAQKPLPPTVPESAGVPRPRRRGKGRRARTHRLGDRVRAQLMAQKHAHTTEIKVLWQ